MLKLQFNLHHQNIYLVNRGEVVATDSKNYLVAHFNTLTDDWETPLTAIFTDDRHKQPYAVIVGTSEELEENECFVPWEVLTDECNVYVSVYCGNLHTTVTAAFKVQKSGYIEGETPPPPSPTVYDTIIQALQDLDSGKQDKLIAGTNITLGSDGTISASGGVTSYNDLENIPAIKTGEGDFVGTSLVDLPIKGTIHFDRDFFYYNSRFSKICLSDRVFKENNAGADYDFNDIPEVLFTSGWQIFDTSKIINLPQFLHSYSTIAIIQLCTPNATGHFIRGILTLDNNQSKPRLFLQTATADFSMWWLESYPIINQSEWVEVGGSQIVSAVVNQNGTITFTDSDGNTFTTSGASVIGADGFSPTATVTQTQSGATISITDKNGTTTANISNGADGQDYVLTAQDKSDIADIVLSELPTTQGVLYGNTSN